MNYQEVFLAIFSILSALFIIFVVVSLGWYIVWKIFLSRFKLVRELLGLINDNVPASNESNAAKPANATAKSRKIRRD